MINNIGGEPGKLYLIDDDTVQHIKAKLRTMINYIDKNCQTLACNCDIGKKHSSYFQDLLDKLSSGLKEPKFNSAEELMSFWSLRERCKEEDK